MHSNGKSASTLEREAEQSRAHLSATLDELRGSMSPGQVMDQVYDYARQHGAADFMRNLGDQMRANPLPVALIGTGIAWLMVGGGRSRARYGAASAMPRPGYGSPYGDYATPSQQSGLTDSVRQGAHSLGEAAGTAMEAVTDTARQVGDTVDRGTAAMRRGFHDAQDKASAMGNRAAAMGSSISEGFASAAHGAGGARDSMMDSGRSAFRHGSQGVDSALSVIREQPLLLAAVGVALGAVMGAAFPRTRAEDEYLGATSDAVKHQASEFASEQFDRLKDAAEATFDSTKEEAKRQGFSAENTADFKNKAAKVAETAVASAGEQANKFAEGVKADAEKMEEKAAGGASSSDDQTRDSRAKKEGAASPTRSTGDFKSSSVTH